MTAPLWVWGVLLFLGVGAALGQGADADGGDGDDDGADGDRGEEGEEGGHR